MNFKMFITMLALIFTSQLIADTDSEFSTKLSYERASFAKDGTTIGANNAHNSSDAFKKEVIARIFWDASDGNFDYHTEVQLFNDSDGVDNYYKSNQLYTQRDILREAYFDTERGDWAFRVGKQQVVWGVADGIKLLDLINPTDYSEFNQNTPEDARIPVWMLNAEKEFDDGSNIQVIISQPRESIFAGLNRSIDTAVRGNDLANATSAGIPDIIGVGHNQGHAFILKGVDTITGQQNGFLNIAPDLGSIAAGFGAGFLPFGTQNSFGGLSSSPVASVTPGNPLVNYFTVGAFTSGASLANLSQGFANLQAGVFGFTTPASQTTFDELNFAQAAAGVACQTGISTNSECANLTSTIPASVGFAVNTIFAQASGTLTGAQILDAFGNGYGSNLSSYTGNDGDNSAFEYMKLASFATFDTFVNARSQYVFNLPDDTDANIALRFKKSLNNGLNYSANYSYNYDTNPVLNLSWRNDAGEVLTKNIVTVTNTLNLGGGATQLLTGYHIALTDSQGDQYGGAEATAAAGGGASLLSRSAILTFGQTLERAHNIGGSLDYALDTKEFGAVVLRAESLYQKDVYSPIIDKSRLSFGDLTDALKMIPGDRFKYVLGVDITVLTNMLVSAQFIQDRNLDYIDGRGALDVQCVAGIAALNTAPPNGSGLNLDANQLCAQYTGDFASMHLTNGLLKAEENKNFYSLYLSKPFGSSGQHRWNNIFIFEDRGSGGKWNRLNAEYSFSDDVLGTIEWNRYWGEDNSQFGQLGASSNAQIGIEYRF